MFKCNTLVSLYTLKQFFVVMTGCTANKVEFRKTLAFHARQRAVNLFKKFEHRQTVVNELAVGRTAALPVCNDVEVHHRFCTVFNAGLYCVPLYWLKLNKHRRAFPLLLLFDKFDVVVPKVDILYCSVAYCLKALAKLQI